MLKEVSLRTHGSSCPMRDQVRKSFAKDPAGTAIIRAAEAPDAQGDGDGPIATGYIVQSPFVVAVLTGGATATAWTADGSTGNGEDDQRLIRLEDVLYAHLACLGKEESVESHGVGPVRGSWSRQIASHSVARSLLAPRRPQSQLS
jgi:hypothetical protein